MMESGYANTSQGDSFKRMSLVYFGFMTAKTCEKSVLHVTHAQYAHKMLTQHQCPLFMRKLGIRQRVVRLSNRTDESTAHLWGFCHQSAHLNLMPWNGMDRSFLSISSSEGFSCRHSLGLGASPQQKQTPQEETAQSCQLIDPAVMDGKCTL